MDAMNELIREIYSKVEQVKENNNNLVFPDGGVHILLAIFDLLEISEEDRYMEVGYKVRGCKIMERINYNEKVKLDKKYKYLIGE